MNSMMKWRGPKEWRPEHPPSNPFLSHDERVLITRIQKTLKEGVAPRAEDIAFLLNLVAKVTRLSPDEHDFPDELALLNQTTELAYRMAFVKELDLYWTLNVSLQDSFENIQIYDHPFECHPLEAALVVRPFFRVERSTDPDIINKLRRTTLKVWVDGLVVVDGPLTPHLIAEDNTYFRKILFRFRDDPQRTCFLACRMDDRKLAVKSWVEGIFLVNGARIQMILKSSDRFTAKFTAGLVAGLYKAKASHPDGSAIMLINTSGTAP